MRPTVERNDLRPCCFTCPDRPRMSPAALAKHLATHGKIQTKTEAR